jgi:uncharacterized membrane protein
MKDNSKTTLIFFGSMENSKYGTLRSVIALVLLVGILFALKQLGTELSKSLTERPIGVLIVLVVIVSAICVQVPIDRYDALKYGASVGAALSLIAVVAWSKDLNASSAGFVVSSTLLASIISLIVYELSKKLDWYPIQI